MNRAFKVREGAVGFDESLWGQVIFYNEEMAERGLTELTKEDMDAAIEAGEVEEVEYDPAEAERVFQQIQGVLAGDDAPATFFSSDSPLREVLPTYESDDRVTVGQMVLDFIETTRDVAEMFSLVVHVDARLGALPKYGPDDAPTSLLLQLKIATPISSPQEDDPLAVSDYVTEFGVRLGRSSIEANRDAADAFCGWLTRGLAGQGCVVDFTGLD